MKKKVLNAERSEGSRQTDPTTPCKQEASAKTTPARPERSDEADRSPTEPAAPTAPRDQVGPQEESAKQIEPPTAPSPERTSSERGDSAETVPEGLEEEAQTAGEPRFADETETKTGTADETDTETDTDTDSETEFDEAVVEHVRLLASLIDEVDLSREETIEQLRRIMRQHSIWKETGLDYALRQVKEKPP